MKFRNKSRLLDNTEEVPAAESAPLIRKEAEEGDDCAAIKVIGWISAGLGAVALGLFVGRELRQRYKFNRRTPYDFYSHSGDENDVEVGLGI